MGLISTFHCDPPTSPHIASRTTNRLPCKDESQRKVEPWVLQNTARQLLRYRRTATPHGPFLRSTMEKNVPDKQKCTTTCALVIGFSAYRPPPLLSFSPPHPCRPGQDPHTRGCHEQLCGQARSLASASTSLASWQPPRPSQVVIKPASRGQPPFRLINHNVILIKIHSVKGFSCLRSGPRLPRSGGSSLGRRKCFLTLRRARAKINKAGDYRDVGGRGMLS